VARASQARDVLPEALRARGAEVDVLALYETVPEPLSAPALAEAQAADYITFTSSSTVRFFLQAAGQLDVAESGGGSVVANASASRSAGLSPHTRIVSIGPVTSEALREHGLLPDIEAARHDIDGVLEALLADAGAQ
jgi:uroporphyrinogen III methyltransferase / synthase